jgi:hypothetical protein
VIHALVVEVIARVFVRHGASRAHLSQVIEGRDFTIFLCLVYLVVGLADAARKAGITGGPGRDKNHFGAVVVLLLERRDRRVPAVRLRLIQVGSLNHRQIHLEWLIFERWLL